jgi:hypothetical protein
MLYPPPYRKMTKNIIGCKAVSDVALNPLEFARQDIVGELHLGYHRRVFTNQLQFYYYTMKVVDRRLQQGWWGR